MTQDCSNSPSTADVSQRLPKGIHITGADRKSDPGIERMPWGYLFIHNKTAQVFEKEMEAIRKIQHLPMHVLSIVLLHTGKRTRREE